MAKRYLVEARSKAFFDTLKKARMYAYDNTYSDMRAYIYTGPEPDDKLIGFTYQYGGIKYWHTRGVTYFLRPDGSVIPLLPPEKKKKRTERTNEFGLTRL